MNPDFLDIIRSLLDAEAGFLIVGAYALNLYVDPRATGDLDLWVEASASDPLACSHRLFHFSSRVPDAMQDSWQN